MWKHAIRNVSTTIQPEEVYDEWWKDFIICQTINATKKSDFGGGNFKTDRREKGYGTGKQYTHHLVKGWLNIGIYYL